MSTKDTPLTYVQYLWNDAEARAWTGWIASSTARTSWAKT